MGSEYTSEMDMKANKKEKEILIVQDHGHFEHDTLDTYDGFFEAKKKDRSVKMHGVGLYKTAEGDIYTGVWEYDKLGANETVLIHYTDGSKYEGYFKDGCYFAEGSYTYPDESVLKCEFVEDAPVGNLQLTDPNGHIWLGTAGLGCGSVNPVNHYYDMLESDRQSMKTRSVFPSTPVPTNID